MHLLDLPDAALNALVAAAERSTRQALHAPCQRMRAMVNAQTQEVCGRAGIIG